MNMKNNLNTRLRKMLAFSLIVIAFGTFLAGCSNGMEVVSQDFGNSVKQMEYSQAYNKAAIEHPNPNAPEGIDGNKSLADLEQLERPVGAEQEMLNYIKAQKYEVGRK